MPQVRIAVPGGRAVDVGAAMSVSVEGGINRRVMVVALWIK